MANLPIHLCDGCANKLGRVPSKKSSTMKCRCLECQQLTMCKGWVKP